MKRWNSTSLTQPGILCNLLYSLYNWIRHVLINLCYLNSLACLGQLHNVQHVFGYVAHCNCLFSLETPGGRITLKKNVKQLGRKLNSNVVLVHCCHPEAQDLNVKVGHRAPSDRGVFDAAEETLCT